MVVMHVCDEPLCVERTHLRLGTQRDNLADRDAKGRQAKGERHGSSRLTEDFVRRIRWAASRGLTQQQIADLMEISNQSVSNILTGKTWSHVR
jgi:ribosome-binding protein aMBF1 (putative translation factor)